MQAAVERVDLEYEADFSVPLFDLPVSSTKVLRSLHESINPSYPIRIRSSDMQVSQGERLSETRVQVSLFDGNGLIDVTADRLSIRFEHMRVAEQAGICKECISWSEQALRRVFPDLGVHVVTLNPTLYLRLGDGSISARGHLAQVAGSGVKIDLSGFGGAICHPCINLEVENENEHWSADFHVYGEWWDAEPSLIASCRVMYDENGTVRGLEDRVRHVDRLLATLLGGIDLDVSGPLLGMAKGE